MTRRSNESNSVLRAQDTPPEGDGSRSTSWRTLLIGAGVGLPVSLALLLLSVRHLDAEALGASIRGAEPWLLALAVCAMLLVYVVQAARWRLIAAADEVRVATFTRWIVGAIAVNNVVPGRPGDLLRVEWLARSARVPRTRAFASVVVDRGLDLLTLVAALAVTYPAVDHASWLNRLWLAGMLVGVVVAVVLVATAVFTRGRELSPRAGRARALLVVIAQDAGRTLRGRHGLRIVLLSVLAWGVWALSAWLVSAALGLRLNPLEILFVTAVLNLGVAIPSSPGFIGTYQWLAVSALGLLGVPHAEAFAFSVLMHGVWFLPTTLAGAVYAVRRLPPVVAGVVYRRTSESHAA